MKHTTVKYIPKAGIYLMQCIIIFQKIMLIIYQNGLIRLDYDPATDILFADLPDFHDFSLSEVRQALKVLIESLVNYDIKNLLINSSKAIIDVTEKEYTDILTDFARDLASTRMQKLARIMSTNNFREEKVADINNALRPSFELRNFKDKETALHWLKGIKEPA